MITKRTITLVMVLLVCGTVSLRAGTKHSLASAFPSYEGRVMCGYQGWFRAQGDGSGAGWVHFGVGGKFDPEHLHIDYWPDVSEYSKTYPTAFKLSDGSDARIFSSWD